MSDDVQPDAATDTVADDQPDVDTGDTDTFDRPYVERLRRESATYRDKAKTAESRATELEGRLTALERTRRVESLAREMGLPESLWGRVQGDDDDAVIADIYALLDGVKAANRVTGDVGQGKRDGAEPVNLAAMLRGRV